MNKIRPVSGLAANMIALGVLGFGTQAETSTNITSDAHERSPVAISTKKDEGKSEFHPVVGDFGIAASERNSAFDNRVRASVFAKAGDAQERNAQRRYRV